MGTDTSSDTKHWLIVYDRPRGQLLRCEEYADSAVALGARFALEDEYRDQPELEIVVLGADSLETIKRTHGRYFFTMAELAGRMLEGPVGRRIHTHAVRKGIVVRYSHRGTSMGPLGWLVVTLLAIGAACLALGWPLALANEHGHNGHMAAWGVPAEIGWLLVLILGAGLTAALKNGSKPSAGRSEPTAADSEPSLEPRNERMHFSDRR